jgi:hypothetical protein
MNGAVRGLPTVIGAALATAHEASEANETAARAKNRENLLMLPPMSLRLLPGLAQARAIVAEVVREVGLRQTGRNRIGARILRRGTSVNVNSLQSSSWAGWNTHP